jgi:hypothetical protein
VYNPEERQMTVKTERQMFSKKVTIRGCCPSKSLALTASQVGPSAKRPIVISSPCEEAIMAPKR